MHINHSEYTHQDKIYQYSADLYVDLHHHDDKSNRFYTS